MRQKMVEQAVVLLGGASILVLSCWFVCFLTRHAWYGHQSLGLDFSGMRESNANAVWT